MPRPMNYRLLGRSGLRVSELALGAMTFGMPGWGVEKDESRRVYDGFREAGGNFIDTANLYSGGRSETFLGEFLAGERERIVLATKYTGATRSRDVNAAGNSRKNMMDAVHASLKRLQTDYIDLYWVHARDFTTPIEEVMRGLDDLVRQGKILYAGISDTRLRSVARPEVAASRLYLPVRIPEPSVSHGVTARSSVFAIGRSSRSTARSSRLYLIWSPTNAVQPRSSASMFARDTSHAGVSETPA